VGRFENLRANQQWLNFGGLLSPEQDNQLVALTFDKFFNHSICEARPS
jgi:hypothetical protein